MNEEATQAEKNNQLTNKKKRNQIKQKLIV